jgi:hypothetical protein
VCGREVPKRVSGKPQDKLADLDDAAEAAVNTVRAVGRRLARLIRESIDENDCRRSGAGTGKTTELVNGFSVSSRGRAEVRQIVAVTFTEKAAAN